MLEKFYKSYSSGINLFICLSMLEIFSNYSSIGNYILFIFIFITLYIEIDNRKEMLYQIEASDKILKVLIETITKRSPSFDMYLIENDITYILIRTEIKNKEFDEMKMNNFDDYDKITQKVWNECLCIGCYKKI